MSLSIPISKYLRSLAQFEKKGVACPYCGNIIITKDGSYFACPFCEMHSNEVQVSKQRDDIKSLLVSKNKFISSNAWDDAAKAVDQMLLLDPSPQMIFASAIFYESFSNHCWHDVDYSIGGYMEQNSINREKSWVLKSKSRTLLYRDIKICGDEIKTGKETDIAFIKFLAEMKVSKFAQAKDTLGIIMGSSTLSRANDYACMSYYSQINDQKNAIKYIDSISTTDLSAFYYLAKLLVKNRRNADACKILFRFVEKASMPKATELLFKLKSVGEK